MNFEFDNQMTPQNNIDIEDIGQCCLECSNEEGYYYYIIIRTSMGITSIATCGPVVPDLEQLPNGYSTYLKKIEYREDKIAKEIKYFLNDKKKINQATEISFEDAIANFRDLGAYLKSGGF